MDTLTTTPPANYGELVDFWNKQHADGFFPTSTPAMIEELQAANDKLRKEIETECAERTRLLRNLDTITMSYQARNKSIEHFMDTLLTFLTDGDIEHEVAEDLASCFGRDLARRVNVTVTAEIDMEVSVPFDYDIEDLEGDLYVTIDTHGLTEINIDTWEASSITVQEN